MMIGTACTRPMKRSITKIIITNSVKQLEMDNIINVPMKPVLNIISKRRKLKE